MHARTRRRLGLAASFGLVSGCLAAGAYAVVSGAIGPSPEPSYAQAGAMGMIGTTMSTSSCELLSPSAIDASINQLVGVPHGVSTPLMTRCTYGIHGSTKSVVVTYTMRVLPVAYDHLVDAMASERAAPAHSCPLARSIRCRVIEAPAPATSALLLFRGTNQAIIVAPGTSEQLERLARILTPSM